jgi:dolichyldiphosphatase
MAGRVPFGMFYVLVDPDKPFEKVLALATMAPYFLVCALTILIVRCRELLTITWLTGQLLNETANFVLKRQFKQARPDGAPKVGFDEHGMPSAHAQFMGFFLAFAVCVLLFRVRVNLLSKLSVIACTLTLTGLVCFSRIELGFHTHEQVRNFSEIASRVSAYSSNIVGIGWCRSWLGFRCGLVYNCS